MNLRVKDIAQGHNVVTNNAYYSIIPPQLCVGERKISAYLTLRRAQESFYGFIFIFQEIGRHHFSRFLYQEYVKTSKTNSGSIKIKD